MIKQVLIFAITGAFASAGLGGFPAHAEDVGCVSTNIRVLGLANDKICVDSFKDPKVDGVVCHVSRAKTGGVSGAVGLAEDTSDASIACRQVGPITIKKLQVVRFYDKSNNTLVYLSYSDKLIEGSPKNAITTVPIMPWAGK